MKAKALCGEDYIRNGNWQAMVKSRKGWEQWADREAKRLSKQDKMKWNAVVIWSDWKYCYRVNFASQKEV